jgi:hypothetical protein
MRGKISSINKYRKFKEKLLGEYSEDSGIRRGLIEFVYEIPERRIEEFIRQHSLKPEGHENEEMFDVDAIGPARILFYLARMARRKIELSELEHAAECFFGKDKKYEMYQAICVAQAMNVVTVTFKPGIYHLPHAMEVEIKEDNDWRN